MKLFLDTMIWLHYRGIDEIVPAALVSGSGPVVVVVPRITLRELDKHKNSHKNPRVKQRAKRILELIETASQHQPCILKNGIELTVFNQPPSLDFDQHGLTRESADDVLIATALEYQRSHPAEKIRLYTEDTTPRITAKGLGLEALPFPAEFKLPDELDPVEKENRDLKAELERYKNSRPKLRCGFLVGNEVETTLKLTPSRTREYSESDAADMLAKLRAQYPHKRVPSSPSTDTEIGRTFRLLQNLAESPDEIDRYNQDVEEYLSEYAKYLKELHQYEVEAQLASTVEIKIVNDGTEPAEDVDIWLHFPDGCTLYEELPETPAEPDAPVPPRNAHDMMLSRLAFNLPRSAALDYAPMAGGSFSLKKTNSYEIEDKFDRIKHGHARSVDKFILTFRSYDEAESFQVDYRITAANLPGELRGSLNVRVDK